MADAGQDEAPPPREIPLLEWVVAALGVLLVAATIGYLALQALSRNTTPPDIRIEADPPLALESGWLVRFRALNRGGEPAAEVVIEGALSGSDGVVETSQATLDYLPPGSERAGGLLFSRDPGMFDWQIGAKGYAQP